MDVILAPGSQVACVAQQGTTTIRIVMTSGDPVGMEFVASLAWPGGNLMGLSLQGGVDMRGKWLELLQAAVPRLARAAYLLNATNPTSRSLVEEMQRLGPALGPTVQVFKVRRPEEFEDAFAAMTRAYIEGLFVDADTLFVQHRTRIVELAATRRLPALYQASAFVEAGGLMSYGVNNFALGRRLAGYVDQLLKGAKPEDLPVEQARDLELVINLKTAQALGLTLPPSLLFQATEAIQ